MVELCNKMNLNFSEGHKERYPFSIMILLNRRIIPSQYMRMRKLCKYVICADGAANKLYELEEKDNLEFIPHYIIGDFDSITSEVKEFYQQKSAQMIVKRDNDNSDLEKCLYYAIELLGKENYSSNDNENLNCKKNCIFVVGANGGRIDHTFFNYHYTLKYLNLFPQQLEETDIFLISKKSISVFLRQGINLINFKHHNVKGFSIFPIYGESSLKLYNKDDTLIKGIFINSIEYVAKFGESLPVQKICSSGEIKIAQESEKLGFVFMCVNCYSN